MKTGLKHVWLILFFVGILLLNQPCWAQDPALEQIGDYGTIDWVGQKVIAKGIGAPPEEAYGKPKARPMAG